MKLSFAVAVSCMLCTAVHADPRTTDLQQRATEGLAADGIALTARNLELRVEPADQAVVVSIVERDTGRVIGVATLAPVPADHDAAIASVVHVAAGLLAQATPPQPALVVDHSAAEHEYARRAIHFSDIYNTSGTGNAVTTARRWAAFQGEINAELDRPSFYRLVGRSDLADRFETHKHVTFGLLGLAAAGTAVAVGVMIDEGINGPFATSNSKAGFIGGLGVGLGGFIAAMVVARTADGVSPGEAIGLADQYNERLRHDLALPSADVTPRVRDLQVSVTGNGLSLTGAF